MATEKLASPMDRTKNNGKFRVDSVKFTHVRVPLVEAFRISSGAVVEKDGIVVELLSEGLHGYGESSPMSGSFYSTDTPETSWNELCRFVGPLLPGKEFETPEDWNAALDQCPIGNFTKAGVETAFWDLAAQRQGLPLHEFLGGTRGAVESGLAVGLYDDVADMLRTVERYLVAGYRRVKLKIEPGRDLEIVRAARKEFGDIPMYVDANCAYTRADIDLFQRMDEFQLMMYEQPFAASALEESAELQRSVRTPVCLDESLDSLEQLKLAHQKGSFQIANFKIQRVGGFLRCLQMDAFCREQGIPAWAGTMPELGIGQAQGAALASLANFQFPTDVEASDRWFCDDIIEPFIRVENGQISLPKSPGLGYSVPLAKLDRYRIASRSFPE